MLVKNIFKKKKIMKICSIIFSVIIIIVLLLIFCNYKQKNDTYNEALNFAKNKQYEEAIESFCELDNYKNSKKLMQKTYCDYAKEEIQKKNYKHALEMLDYCGNNTDTKDLITETKYNYAISIFLTDYQEAKEILNELDNYKDSKKYLKKIHSLENMIGGFTHKNAFENIKIITTSSICKIYYIDYDKNVDVETYRFTFVDYKSFKCGDIVFKENSLFESGYCYTADKIKTSPEKWALEKYNVSFFKKDETIPSKPKIGMSREEVNNSTWGEPRDINKSTYSWGTTEQWVYPDNKYVYFDDGIVTSVSE